MSVGVSVAGLVYQCISQRMMAGNEVVVSSVQPVQVFHLWSMGQLASIAGLAGQHQVPYTV